MTRLKTASPPVVAACSFHLARPRVRGYQFGFFNMTRGRK
jgi:hypothetical protein